MKQEIDTKAQSYKNLKKYFNAKTKDELIINMLEQYNRLVAVTDSCGFCSDNIITTADVPLEDVKHTCEEINNTNS